MTQSAQSLTSSDEANSVSMRASPQIEDATSERGCPSKRTGRVRLNSPISQSLCFFIVAAGVLTHTTAYTNPSTSILHSSYTVHKGRYHHLRKKQPTMFGIRNVVSSSKSFQLFATAEEEVKRKSIQKTVTKKKTRGQSEEEDWEALTAAFQMYKAAYGDLKVPSRFVVPSMPPWPESGWGLKLGQRVANIRSTGKYVENNEERRKLLDEMGFLWRLRAPSPERESTDETTFAQIFAALQTYRTEVQAEGPLSIPPNFVVPSYDPWPEATRGMPLGKKVPTVRTKTYLKANPEATEKLRSIGFQFDGKAAANDARFNNVYSALVRYSELNGDLYVPQPFVVPEGSEDWEEEFYGLRLGARVNAIRSQGTFIKTNPERRELLDKLGFEWELPPSSSGKKRGRKKKSEIEVLAGPAPPGLLEGGIPGQDQSGLDTTSESGSTQDYKPVGEDFFQIGNNPDAPVWGFEDEEAERDAQMQLEPDEDEYQAPKNLNTTLTAAAERAMEVGVIKSLGAGKRVTKGSINKVVPWFNDDFGDAFVFGDVVEALTVYKNVHGSFESLVDDQDFVVPDPSFAGDIDSEASRMAAEAIAEAEATGGDSEALIAAEIERMEMEMAAAESSEDGNSESDWPEHLAGMKLGWINRRIRDGSLEVKHLPARKKQLDAIKFDWGDEKQFLDVPFEKAMCAMFAYFLVRGDLFVYEDFVMPGDEPWPTVFDGFELGKAVKRIRELQNVFEAYHPEKVTLLRRIEFVWFPELALPLNPEDGRESWEDSVVEGLGHPFFQLNDPLVETIEEIQAEGPFGTDDKTKSWYDYKGVSNFWERADVMDTGKGTQSTTWRPAQWLAFNGYNQLAGEHEERYGIDPGLEMVRLIESFHNGEITESEFDERGQTAIFNYEVDKLRSEAISAGIELDADDDLETMVEKISSNPEYAALDDDPEYKELLATEIDLEEARHAPSYEVEEVEEIVDVEEENIDEDDYEWEDDEYAEEEVIDAKKNVVAADDDDDDGDYVDDAEEEIDEVEEEEEVSDEDFGIKEEELL